MVNLSIISPAMRTVFVSSTSEDLKPCRQVAKDVILDLGWHPVMMEHFGADGSVGTVDACKIRVAGSDLVLAILGWRRGWVPESEIGGDGRSITQIEIETAKAFNKPVIFLLADDRWPGEDWERETEARQQVEEFRRGIDRLAVFFPWEPLDFKAAEMLPLFRGKARQELMRHWKAEGLEPETLPIPRYQDELIRGLSEALEEAHLQEETIISSGGDPTAVRREIIRPRRQIREGGNVRAGDFLVGRFKLIELLGDGGFATVWKAFDKTERRLVAVKVLHAQYAQDRTRRERFFRGARKMAELHHSGIVRVFEKKLDDGGFHFFVMELVQGDDLRKAVTEKRLVPTAIYSLIRRVAEVLQFAHDKGVIHRDVKPANILLGADGPKLTDFDLVRAVDTTGGTSIGGGLFGTFLYTAPECMRAPEEAGPAADVYSLAMTAAFCLHGTELPIEVMRDASQFIERLSCPLGVRRALIKGASWVASERFQSVSMLVEAIEGGISAPIEFGKPAPTTPRRWPKSKASPPRSSPLRLYLEEIVALPKSKRSEAVLKAIERALPIASEDLRSLGMIAWALDYFPGRGARAGEAAALREQAFALIREHPPPVISGRIDPQWAEIPGGNFFMGSPRGKGLNREWPLHQVAISPFRLGVCPVTATEFERIRGRSGKASDFPATGMDWYSAYAYAAWIGGRLPTEAEWEYAARGGTAHDYADRRGRPTLLDRVGWYRGNAKQRPNPDFSPQREEGLPSSGISGLLRIT